MYFYFILILFYIYLLLFFFFKFITMSRRLVKDVLINFPIYRQQGYFTVTLVENGIKNVKIMLSFS